MITGNTVAESTVEILDSAPTFFGNLVWLSSKDAAEYLRKTVGALRVMVCRGQIRAYKWRRRLFFKRSELDSMLVESSFTKGARKWR